MPSTGRAKVAIRAKNNRPGTVGKWNYESGRDSDGQMIPF